MRTLAINLKSKITEQEAEALALSALGWILGDEKRTERFIDLTGLTGDDLRARLGERPVLAAILGFLTRFEADLISAAEALGVPPETLAHAQQILDPEIFYT